MFSQTRPIIGLVQLFCYIMIMYKGIIYKYISPSGKIYIGQTINESQRRKTFKNINLRYAGGKIDIARNKYGPDKFKYSIEAIIEKENREELLNSLNELEIYYISKYNSFENGYNSTLGGENGHIITEEEKEKIRKKLSYKILQYDLNGTFIKIWENGYQIEKTLNIDRESVQRCCRGEYKYSNGFIWKYYQNDFPLIIEGLDELKQQKIKNMQSSVYNNDGKKCKKVLQYDILGNFIKQWNSIKEVSEFYNIKQNSISQCCNGVSKTCGGYIWKFYKENYPLKIEIELTQMQILKAAKVSGMLRIYKYDLNMKLLDTYRSLQEAALSNNISRTEQITACFQGGSRLTCKNFIWRYGLELG